VSLLELTVRLVAGVFLIAANAFFVAVEFALTRLRALEVDENDLAASPGLRRAWDMTEELMWKEFGDDYLLSCQPAEIAWHARLLALENETAAAPLFDLQDSVAPAGTSVLVYAPQAQFTFAIVTAVIDEFGLSLTDARIVPLENECSLSMYTIHEQDGQPISEQARRDKLRHRLSKAVRGDEDSTTLVTRKAPRQVRMFSTPSRIRFARDTVRGRTVMDIVTGDRPGLAARIGRVLRGENVFIRMAKLVTVGERAEDVFYITDERQQPLSQARQNQLEDALLEAIDKNSNQN